MNGRLGEWGSRDIHDDVIAAFADGEPVDPARLRDALSEAEGREHLIDLLVLRSLVGGPGSDAGGRFARIASLGRETTPGGETTPGVVSAKNDPGRRFRVRRLLATAAVVALGVLGGFVAGQRLADSRAQAPATTAANISPRIVPASAPSPTRVIRLENGVDWNERGGGH